LPLEPFLQELLDSIARMRSSDHSGSPAKN
jgi:hypothetical protein